jgi:hypothetical protein
MAGRRNHSRTWRCNLTIGQEAAKQIKAYAASVDRRPTTAATELLLAGLAAAGGDGDEELADLRRRNQELQDQVDALRRSRVEDLNATERADEHPPAPRWELPVDKLVADASWWDRSLPRLYEILGRADASIPYLDSDGDTAADERGYIDLMGCLFPPVGEVAWRSPRYPEAVNNASASPSGQRQPTRVHVWEPVLRHMALALSAVEDTGTVGSSPHLRLEALARISGTWVTVLNSLVGAESRPLPGPLR